MHVFEYITMNWCWRQTCSRIILIIQGTIREAPRQTWRFKEDFSRGNDTLSASENL